MVVSIQRIDSEPLAVGVDARGVEYRAAQRRDCRPQREIHVLLFFVSLVVGVLFGIVFGIFQAICNAIGIGFITFVVMFILYVLAISISMSISASFWKQLKDNVE